MGTTTLSIAAFNQITHNIITPSIMALNAYAECLLCLELQRILKGWVSLCCESFCWMLWYLWKCFNASWSMTATCSRVHRTSVTEAKVIELFTMVIYRHSMVLLSFCVMKQYYCSIYHDMAINYIITMMKSFITLGHGGKLK